MLARAYRLKLSILFKSILQYEHFFVSSYLVQKIQNYGNSQKKIGRKTRLKINSANRELK